MKKPIVGVTSLWDEARRSHWMLPGYLDGLQAAGAIPVTLPLSAEPADIAQLAALCDGFLFTGGQDVSPRLYGQEPGPGCGETCPGRDQVERELLRQALERNRPVLGICRGIQFLNAALGGDLYQDLPSERPSAVQHRMLPPYDRAAHTVHLLPGTPLAALLEAEEIGVNSCHHQGLRRLAPGLQEMARSADGLVEAVCLPEKAFVWAVQWHPEMSFRTDENSRRIFSAFVRACTAASN